MKRVLNKKICAGYCFGPIASTLVTIQWIGESKSSVSFVSYFAHDKDYVFLRRRYRDLVHDYRAWSHVIDLFKTNHTHTAAYGRGISSTQ